MLPAAFDYRAPATLAEALGVLKEKGDDAKVLAGGMSLIPLLKLRFSQPQLIVDIGRIPGLADVKRDDGHVRIGALVRNVDVERSKDLAKLVPLMVEAVPWISDPLVRNRGTVVGSVCHADPSGDWGSIMLALDAELVAQSTKGERVIPIDGFFEGPFTTTLRSDEIATAIRIPLPKGPAGRSYHKLERRVGDFATVAVSVHVELDGRKVIKAGIGMTSVGATNLKAKQAEKALIGHELKDDVIAEAAKLAAAESEPKDDIRGTAAYKKDMVRVFVQRGLKTALARAQEVRA